MQSSSTIIFSRKHFYFCIYTIQFTSPSREPVKLPIAITCQTLLLSGYLQAVILKRTTITTTTIIIPGFATYSRQLLHCALSWQPEVPVSSVTSLQNKQLRKYKIYIQIVKGYKKRENCRNTFIRSFSNKAATFQHFQ